VKIGTFIVGRPGRDRRRSRWLFGRGGLLAGGLCLAAALLGGGRADAVTKRFQIDQRGDFVLLGNTVGQDCGNNVPAAVVGTKGACGNNTTDTAPDIYWRSDDATSTAAASTAITAAQARSTAVLAVPAGATITYARLYWSSAAGGGDKTTVTLDRVGTGAFSATVTADATPATTTANATNYYQSTAEITTLVQANGVGAYRVGGIDSLSLINLNSDTVYVAWSMVVFYQLDSDPQRNLTIFDGLDTILSQGAAVTVNLSGFVVPNTGFKAKLGVVAYEGDNTLPGDSLSFNGVALSDAVNPANNFFNSSRSNLGVPVSNAGDLPQLTGAANSMSSFDLDVVDISSELHQGDTSATITASTNQDFYLLGAWITSVATFKPDFGNVNKTVTDLTVHPGGLVFPGDVIQYTITALNAGNDDATNAVLTDAVPANLTFVPGSIQIVTGPNAGTKTDAADGDQGEYIGASRTVRVRLGTGANNIKGGTIPVGQSSVVTFKATVDSSAAGRIENQAIINASGAAGAPATDYLTNNGGGAGMPAPTPIIVDKCGQDSDCSGPTPFCLTSASPKICIGCRAGTDCNGATPTCDGTTHMCRACDPAGSSDCAAGTPVCVAGAGTCVECTATDKTHCGNSKPACDVDHDTCVECVDDSTCGGSAPKCNTATHACVGCLDASDCGGTKPVCDPLLKTCGGCLANSDCGGAAAACQPSGACGQCSANDSLACTTAGASVCDLGSGTCVACVDNGECGGNAPICNLGTHLCRPCGGDTDCGGATPACQLSTGACGVCSSTNRTACTGATTFCDIVNVVCVGCLASSDCAGDKPICDGGGRTCRACNGAGDCPGADPVCTPSGACHECAAGNIGACASPKGVCDTSTDACVGCLSSAGCPGSKPVCDGASKACRGCAGDGECGGTTPVCLPAGSCGQCTATNKSACPTDRSVCDVAGGGNCVGCLANTDCSGPTPFCSTATHACIPCTADGAPSCADPARPYCQPSGALAGACTECTALHLQLCGAEKPACLVNVGLCGCSNVIGDGDCGGKTSGLICNGPAGICVPGCSAASGRNGCPVGQTCSDVSGGVGTCSPTGGCSIDGDCVLPTTACNTSVTPHQCVQCLSDAGCALPLVCSPTAHACVDCTPTNTTACLPTGSGSACLTGGTCGCSIDGDCGGVASGRICDGSLHKCTIGCRGQNGNGCPADLVCTSDNASAGQCKTSMDGGTDGKDASSVDGNGGDGRDGNGSAGDGAGGDGAGTDGMGKDATGDARDGAGNGDTLADGGGKDGTTGGDATTGKDGSGADGSHADGSGQLNDGGGNDTVFGDSGIGIRPLNLAGGGCQCAMGASGDPSAPAALSVLLLAAIVGMRRRRR
jgi:uncharacterized repeat protein (TIGR01451 family)/MYXO-CTERM domain-containing protein